jgi:nitrite reductase/ring-hydroxylating ferredoxin subunit
MGMGVRRRNVLGGASVLGAAGLLAACGDGTTPAPPAVPGGSSPSVTTATTPGATTTSGPPANAVAASDIPAGGGRIFPDRKTVVTQPSAGEFRAFDTTCPHQGCLVTDVSNGLITCPCHLSQFRVADGSVARGPSERGLTAKPATVQGNWVVLG